MYVIGEKEVISKSHIKLYWVSLYRQTATGAINNDFVPKESFHFSFDEMKIIFTCIYKLYRDVYL